MSTSISQILDAVDSSLTVIQTVANTPGVNIIPYVATISSAISAIKTAESIGKNIVPYVIAVSDTFSGGTPTQDEMDALGAKISELESAVQAPLPDAEAGEPD